MATAQVADTPQERKKADMIRQLRKLIERVETEELYGEFGISFFAQCGKVGHFEIRTKESFK